MKIKFFSLSTSFVLITVFAFLTTESSLVKTVKTSKKTVEEIIASMTLEQKAQLVIGTGMYFEMPDSVREQMPMESPG